MEWIIIVGLVIAMYIIIYKYEKKMDKIHKMVEENKTKIDNHHERIDNNHKMVRENKNKLDTHHNRLDEHYNEIEKMWVTIPKIKDE